MKKLLLLMVLPALLCNSINSQNLHRVNNNTDFDADFTTLPAAVAAASDNDTIYMEGSALNYDGATIDKPLTIVGPGFFLSENPETQANNTSASIGSELIFASGSEGSTLMGCEMEFGAILTISTGDISLIRNNLYQVQFNETCNNIVIAQNYVDHISAGSGIITNGIISNNIVKGEIYALNTSGPLIIANNVCWSTNWTTDIDVHNASIQNNILSGEFVNIQENTGNTISYNILAAEGTDANGNQYNVDMDLVFADFNGALELSTDGKWDLKAGSPALAAGSGGEDCGAFGGSTPYILSGVPSLPHIYEADVPASATSDSGLQVSIKVKSGE